MDWLGVLVVHVDGTEQYFDEAPNEEARRFYDQLEESSRPLCEGVRDSRLVTAIRLMNIKLDWNVPNAAMDSMVDLWVN
ncbi:hypothetical protein H5410_030342 [Solanum commersonii]|uniref:Uncharacterized protein n=1 Tax=Solanum commersonii TaxID=4109 RepID=A0A9J5YIE3_SOLCO|nr:hypothetical protein H5410_030342 [Solanum commersonii]